MTSQNVGLLCAIPKLGVLNVCWCPKAFAQIHPPGIHGCHHAVMLCTKVDAHARMPRRAVATDNMPTSPSVLLVTLI